MKIHEIINESAPNPENYSFNNVIDMRKIDLYRFIAYYRAPQQRNDGWVSSIEKFYGSNIFRLENTDTKFQENYTIIILPDDINTEDDLENLQSTEKYPCRIITNQQHWYAWVTGF